jgi:long-chain acyl-CoA synthetase
MHLAIIGDNRPHLYWAMAAAQCLGGIPVPMYQDVSVKSAVEAIYGASVSMYYDTGSEIINKDNMYLPENQRLLFPFIK